MKKQILCILVLFGFKCAGQDIIYLADGTKIAGKITEISLDQITYYNNANPSGSNHKSISEIQVAFNSSGDYIVFATSEIITDEQKKKFMGTISAPHQFDIIVGADSKVTPALVTGETETTIIATTNSSELRLKKSDLIFILRKNGNHKIYSNLSLAILHLATDKGKIDSLLSTNTVIKLQSLTRSKLPVVDTSQKKTDTLPSNNFEVPDLKDFGNKAKEKVKEFTNYILSIINSKSNHLAAVNSIDLACDLFLNEQSRVEVSNVITQKKNKYKIRDYLNRLLISSSHYDRVQVEYANINYATKFKKGIDGNWYGTVTFVQKFEGFIDGKLAYADFTKRDVTIVLKHYEKAKMGTMVGEWDLYLDDIGVVETKKV